jgi:hypothetical protein
MPSQERLDLLAEILLMSCIGKHLAAQQYLRVRNSAGFERGMAISFRGKCVP